jgi:hypothetical protein
LPTVPVALRGLVITGAAVCAAAWLADNAKTVAVPDTTRPDGAENAQRTALETALKRKLEPK